MSAPKRCRLYLIAPDLADDALADAVTSALSGGDVASVLLPRRALDEQSYQARLQRLVPIVQQAGAAAIVADDTRALGRTGADGVHLGAADADLAETVARLQKQGAIVGLGGAESRHAALELGEARPDYLLFGRIDGDRRPQAHPRDVELGEWWAAMIEIPAVVVAGSTVESVEDVAMSGVEFVAVTDAVFGGGEDPAERVRLINRRLDAVAPRFED